MEQSIEDVARGLCDMVGVTRYSDMRTYCEHVAKLAIERERSRCVEICEAEREWGGTVEEAQERISSGAKPRQIPGWNCPYDEEGE